jgi:hypothetical protein
MTETPSTASPQPKDTADLYRLIAPLSDERRLEARDRARALVVKAAGTMPEPKDFTSHTESKYPNGVNWTINLLCLVVLIAAFLPSAIRLFYIGSHTFADTIPDAFAAMVAGYSIVIMAEISMVLFSIASVIVESHKAPQTDAAPAGGIAIVWRVVSRIDSVKLLLIVSQLVATAIALVGNAQVSLMDGHASNPFAVIEAFSPSIVVFTTSYILKAQMLSAIERRHANTRAFTLALNAWKIATGQPETDARFRPALHNALRDFLREDNGKGTGATARKEFMASLVIEDWKRLVKRELMADEWYSDPDAQTQSVLVQPQAVRSVRSFAANERMNGNGAMNGEFIQPVHSLNGVNEYDGVNGEFVHSDRSVNSANGYTKRMDAKTVARLYLEQHPEHMGMRLDDLVPLIVEDTGVKVGRTSVHNARKEMGG